MRYIDSKREVTCQGEVNILVVKEVDRESDGVK